MGQYLVSAKYGYNKLWSNDSGRNLAGSMSGTLIGIFPKIVLQFRQLNKSELEVVVPILDSARQTTTYYDPYKKANTTMETYTGDYEIENNNIVGQNGHKNKGFSCSFIATRKRS
jgi:hypothetical protein